MFSSSFMACLTSATPTSCGTANEKRGRYNTWFIVKALCSTDTEITLTHGIRVSGGVLSRTETVRINLNERKF